MAIQNYETLRDITRHSHNLKDTSHSKIQNENNIQSKKQSDSNNLKTTENNKNGMD